MGGGKGGGSGGSNVNVAPSPYETQMAAISGDLYGATTPLRQAMLKQYQDIMGVQTVSNQVADPRQVTGYEMIPGGGASYQNALGEYVTDPVAYDYSKPIYGPQTYHTETGYTYGEPAYDITELPTYKPLFGLQKQSLESQYQQAKQNLIGSVPRGGNMAGALTGLEANRAAAVGAMPAELGAGILSDLMNKAYGVAYQTPTTTLSGLGSAAGTYGNRQAAALSSSMAQQSANQQSSFGLMGQLGGAVGSGIGKAIGGK